MAISKNTSCRHLGGDDFDHVLIDYLADQFYQKERVDLRKDPMALQRLKEAAEKAKIELSSSNATEVNLPYITAVAGVPKHLVQKISRSKFEQLSDDLVMRTLEPCAQALKDAGLDKSEIDEVILVGGSTRIPKIQEEVQKFFNKKPNRSVNPDEVVGLGASIQGGVLSGDLKDEGILLLDVTPLSFGIETMGGVYDVVIEANTTIPSKKSKIYSTASDNQPSVEIHILQGERPMARDNRSIGRFILDGIPPSPRGMPQVEVTFDIDANGILNVSAMEKKTGKKQNIRIEASTGLSKEEVARMKAEAKANEAADKAEREKVDKLNAADNLVFQSEKQLKEFGEKLPPDAKSTIETAIEALKDAHKRQDIAGIDAATETLNQAWQAASQHMYQDTQNPGSNAAPNSDSKNENSDDDVTDVEYEEVKN